MFESFKGLFKSDMQIANEELSKEKFQKEVQKKMGDKGVRVMDKNPIKLEPVTSHNNEVPFFEKEKDNIDPRLN